MVTEARDVVERTIRIAARPDIVFGYFVDPERMARWLGPAILDARPGGELRISVAGVHHGSGQYLEVDRPRRLVYTWGWAAPEYQIPPGSSRVEVELAPIEDGTLLRLRHAGLGRDETDDHGKGWQHYLDRLAIVASGGDPGPDPYAIQAQQAATSTRS